MNKIETEDIKELFAEWGLWSLVDDISDDGDGHGDNLQLTKEGLEAERMINLLLSDQSQKQPEGETIRNYNPEKRWDKYKKSKIEVREFDLVPKVQPEKQEGWVEEWRKLSFEIGSITKQQADEVENFISQLLSERTFNKEELEIIAYSVASNATSEDGESLWDKFYDEFTDKYGENNDKLKIGANELIPKLSKLLKEKNG